MYEFSSPTGEVSQRRIATVVLWDAGAGVLGVVSIWRGHKIRQRDVMCARMGHISGAGTNMATDYDAPRRTEIDDEPDTDTVGTLTERHTSDRVDVDENDIAEGFELPGADLSGEELIVKVIPKQADEFTCMNCFLVNHRSRLAQMHGDQLICRDCV